MNKIEKPIFEQNVIAIIWDFDKTLAKEYMQTPVFKKYGIDQKEFWDENDSLYDKYKEMGITVNKDTIYLNHFLTCVEQGIFEGLDNTTLYELGSEILFYEGIPNFLRKVKGIVSENEKYQKYHISVEHYIVSTGLAEMIRGSKVAPYMLMEFGDASL